MNNRTPRAQDGESTECLATYIYNFMYRVDIGTQVLLQRFCGKIQLHAVTCREWEYYSFQAQISACISEFHV